MMSRGGSQVKNRFDLEQDILNAWNITSDISVLLGAWDSLSEDSKLNILVGLRDLYEAKFNMLFNTFEQMINEKLIK
jgi:hypothetical protein